MKSVFQILFVNKPLCDPGIYVRFLWEKRAVIFDLGNLTGLRPSQLMKVSQVFISHTHIDHFIGFDHLLRVILGRDKTIHVFGPPGIIRNVEGKLSGYTWNLVDLYPLVIEVHEVSHNSISRARFRCRNKFHRENLESSVPFQGLLWEDPHFIIRAVHLDHQIPSLAFSLEEKYRINIKKEQLIKLGLSPGPWLNQLKNFIREGKDDHYPITATYNKEGEKGKKDFLLGELKKELVTITRGEKIAYVADALFCEQNEEKIIQLARDADLFFCEAAFLHEDWQEARKKFHLTAQQAGIMAKKANVKKLEIFHFSPRYESRTDELYREAQEAFHGFEG